MKSIKKFLFPVLTLVAIALVSIAFGLGSNSAVTVVDSVAGGNWYQLVWKLNKPAMNIVSFFALCVGAAGLLVILVPFKCRKYTAILTGALLLASGVMMFFAAKQVWAGYTIELSGSMIAMGVLTIIAGVFAGLVGTLELLEKAE